MPPKIMKEIDGAPVYTHSTEAAIDRTVRSFDRGTTAGRLIHQLYNKPRKESTLDLELLKRFAALRSRGADILRVPVEKETREKPTPKSRAYVEYPKLKRAQSLACIRRPNCGGRRLLKVILQKEKMQEDSPTEKKDLEFQEKKKVFCITEQDKELFQRYMQFEGAPPPLPEHRFRTFDEFENQRALGVDRVRVKDKINTTTCSSSKQLDERRELVHLFTVITNEIKERQSLLSSLDEIDSVPSTKLKEEIQERVAELRKIDGWIRELDTQLDDERHV